MAAAYMQKEIETNINLLENKIYILKKERTVISQQINCYKKEVENWKNLDKAQTKMF
jgi:hypothetical protein